MSSGVVAQVDFVAALPDHLAVKHDDASDRILARREIAFSSQLDRPLHPLPVFVRPRHDRTSGTASGPGRAIFNLANRDVNRRRV